MRNAIARLCLLGMVSAAHAVPGDVDAPDLPVTDSPVYASVTERDGATLIAGRFASVAGQSRNNLARINADGTLDSAFFPDIQGVAYCVAVQPDGKILVGGIFTTVQAQAATQPVTRRRVARLNPNGTLDPLFDPNASGPVCGLAVQADGKVLLVGDFTSLQPNGAAAATTRLRVARVHPDGSLDTAFNPIADGIVRSVAVQADGEVLLGGDFTKIAGNNRRYIARVGADGVPDAGFTPALDDAVHAVATLPDGRIVLGGDFTSVQPAWAAGPVPRPRLARLEADGSLDMGFDPQANGIVRSLAVQVDGKLLLGGSFTTLQPGGAGIPVVRNRCARLAADGTADPAFDPNANNTVWSVALAPDGKAWLGGQFTQLQPNGATASTSRSLLARLLNDPAADVLAVTDPTRVFWQRGGASPEFSRTTFEVTTDGGVQWTALGAGARLGTTPDWELTGLALPAAGVLRARGVTSAGVVERTVSFPAGGPLRLPLVSIRRSVGTKSVTLNFTASEPIQPPVVTIAGKAATVVNVLGNQWAATATAFNKPPAGPVQFSIACSDLAGNPAPTVTATTDGTVAVVDNVTLAPTLSAPSGTAISKSPVVVTFTLPEPALEGSVRLIFKDYSTQTLMLTLTLGPGQETAGARTLTFDPSAPVASSNGAVVIATSVLTQGTLPDGDYSLTLSYQDRAGNAAAKATTNFVRIDTTATTFSAVTATGGGLNAAWLGGPGTVQVTFTTSEDHLMGLETGSTIGGQAATLTQVGPLRWRATATIPGTAPEGVIAFALTVKDQAGNLSATVTETSDGNVVRMDRTAPVVTVPDPAPVAEATGPNGAVVFYTLGITDHLDPAPTLRDFGPKSGDVFPLGETQVYARVYDGAGNEVHEPFTVTVVDTTPPVVGGVPIGGFALEAGSTGLAALPSVYVPVLIPGGGGGGITLPGGLAAGRAQSLIKTGAGTVVLPPGGFGPLGQGVTATDVVGVTSRTQVPAPGTMLPLGKHILTLTATDAAGNAMVVQTTVTVAFGAATPPGKTTVTGQSGQPAPATAGLPGDTVLATFGVPAVSDFRELAARVGMLSGRTKIAGIYVVDGARGAALLAFEGGPVPGMTAAGVTFKSFLDPVIAPGGAIAFAGKMQGAVKATDDEGVWTDAFTGGLELILRKGSEIPGLDGAKLKTVTSLSLRDGELLALLTLAPEKGLVTTGDDAVLVRLTGAASGAALLREGRALPGLSFSKIKTMSVLSPSLSALGHGRWHGDGAVVAKVTLTDGRTLLVKIAADGAVTPLLSTADPARPVDVRAQWKAFGLPAMGSDGSEFVLAATLKPQAGIATAKDDCVLLFSPDGAEWNTFAREGELTPISASADAPRYGSFFDPVVNAAGQVAFLAVLNGTTVRAGNKCGLFGGPPDQLRLVARLGDPAPDESGAATGAAWSKFISHALPSGEGAGPIFLAETSGGDTTATNKLALWGVDSTGLLRRLARTGLPVQTGGPALTKLTLLTAVPGAFGATRSFNATGSLAVLATFADRSQALLRLDLP